MASPILYILAGPNGIGKTTSSFDIIPANVPIINSDEIARQVRISGIVNVNTQEYSNREAQRLVKEHLDNNATFAIETNLSDEETWKFLIGVQKSGYSLHLVYLTTDDLTLLNNRIKERSLRGEHYVRPDIVEERYNTSLRLLKHYISVPDIVQLIDNTAPLTVIALKKGDHWEIVNKTLPKWFTNYLEQHFNKQKEKPSILSLSNIDEVREQYRNSKKK